jgi:hypothetical protein
LRLPAAGRKVENQAPTGGDLGEVCIVRFLYHRRCLS